MSGIENAGHENARPENRKMEDQRPEHVFCDGNMRDYVVVRLGCITVDINSM